VKSFLLIVLLAVSATADAALKTENVFLIISDGLRWQEVFRGAEEQLMTKTNGGVADAKWLQRDFLRPTERERREALLPFFWQTIAKQGQLLGNTNLKSTIRVTNGKNFSYPGYNELLSGVADPRIDSNDKFPNPNVTVFEWLDAQRRFKDRVAVFASWDVFPYIFNCERARLPIWPPWEARFEHKAIKPPRDVASVLNNMTPLWSELIFDSFIFEATLDHVKKRKPRVLFIGYGETDEWAHEGRYDLYLRSAHNVDRFTRLLWETVQSMPQYRDKTTFIITADHGRGTGLSAWRDHGKTVGSEYIWLAAIGPDTPPLGERSGTTPLTQAQVAATIGALLGEDFQAKFPAAAPPIGEILGRRKSE
jgi:hypothetical protein